MTKLSVSIDYPDREENEPDLTEKQRSFIKHLLSEVGAVNFPQNTIDGVGYGMDVENSTPVVTGNTIINSVNHGILVRIVATQVHPVIC